MQRFAADVVAALDLIDDIILVLAPGPDGPSVMDVNETFTRVTGYDAEAMRGRPFASLAGKHTLPETLAEIARSVAEIRGLRTEVALATSAGATFWLGFHMTPVLPRPGESGHFVLVGKDITERRRRSLADQAIQALLTGVFVSIDAAVAVTAADGQILAANPCLHALLGHPEGTMVGSHLRQHLAADGAAADARATAEALAQTGAQSAANDETQRGRRSARMIWQRRDGGTLAARVTSAVIERPDLQRVRVLTVHPLDGAPVDQPRLIGRAANAGKLSLIGLQAIRDAYAGQWPAVRHRTLLVAEGIIKRRLARGDTYTRTEDCAFVVWFADGTEEDCALRGARIAREVRIALLAELGDGAAAAVTSITERVTVAPEAVAGDTGALAELDRLLTRRRLEIEGRAKATLARVRQALPAEETPIHDRTGRRVPGFGIDLPKSVKAQVATALAALPEAATDDFTVEGLKLAIAARLAGAADAAAPSLVYVLCLPVAVLAGRRTREGYLDQLRTLPEPVRRRLILLLVEVPEELGASRLHDLARLLKPLVRRVGVEVTSGAALAPVGFAQNAFSIACLEPSAELTNARLRALLPELHRNGVRVLARGLRSTHDADRLAAAGVDLFLGTAPSGALDVADL